MIHTRRLGFTLVELLVVVSIISILAAMLLPTLSRARQTAMGTACSNNQKQLGITLDLYGQENGGLIPPGYDGGVTWYTKIGAYVGFNPAVKNDVRNTVLNCPADKRTVWTGGAPDYLSTRGSWESDYAYVEYNNYDAWPGEAAHYRKEIRLARVRQPSAQFLLADGARYNHLNHVYLENNGASPDLTNPQQGVWSRHSAGANYLHLDGHVQWMTDPGLHNADAVAHCDFYGLKP